jgi:glycine reductase
MHLELCFFPVKDTVFGRKTMLREGILTINREEMRERVNADGFFSEVRIDLAKPGESTRIIHIMDAMQPRCKISGGAAPYPGALGAMHIAGTGRTHVLSGVSVMQTGMRQGIQEGIIDMVGSGSVYSVFSTLHNVVLHCVAPPDTNTTVYDAATRKSLVEAAVYLGEVTRDLEPPEIRVFEMQKAPAASLPRVAYICYLQSQGPLRNTFLYGEAVKELTPTLLHPNEVLDGAIVSGNYIIACQKNPTYLHVNNPVVRELYARHGKTLDFAGVIIANEFSTLTEKTRSAEFAVKLAKQIGAQGIVMTQEGGGHSDTDLMLCTAAAGKQGLKSVMLINELAGANGDQPSLVDTSPLARHVVSTGNNDQVITLPPVEKVLGGSSLVNVPDPAGECKTALGRMYTATNQFGAYNLKVCAF